jgi:predicted transporter
MKFKHLLGTALMVLVMVYVGTWLLRQWSVTKGFVSSMLGTA